MRSCKLLNFLVMAVSSTHHSTYIYTYINIFFQLMINAGIISRSSAGMYTFLPLGYKALQKLIKIVDEEMLFIGGQKILMPALTPAHLWHRSSRLQQAQSELFMVKDRHGKEYLLSPVSYLNSFFLTL